MASPLLKVSLSFIGLLLILLMLAWLTSLKPYQNNSSEQEYDVFGPEQEYDVFGPISDTVNIGVSVDAKQLPGLPTLIYSIFLHTKEPSRIRVSVVYIGKEVGDVYKLLECHGLEGHKERIIVIPFKLKEEFQKLIKVPSKSVSYVANDANFARLLYPEIFPNLTHIISLDVDTVVKADIVELWNKLIESKQVLVASPRLARWYKWVNDDGKKLFHQKYGKKPDLNKESFNAGIYGLNLNLWRQLNLSQDVTYWMNEHHKYTLWTSGVQSIIIVVTYDKWEPVDKRWNCEGLGYRKVSSESIKQAFILHWNGRNKPWLPTEGRYREVWLKYSPLQCNGHGTCSIADNETCSCDNNYSRPYCQHV